MLKVFIADDSDAVRERLHELVSDVEDVTVIGEASDGGQALEGIEDFRPDVVILDIRMPQTNGFDVLERLQGRGSPTVIVLTAFAYRQYREKCLETGASYFFDKATEFERIADVLEELRSQAEGGTPLCRLAF